MVFEVPRRRLEAQWFQRWENRFREALVTSGGGWSFGSGSGRLCVVGLFSRRTRWSSGEHLSALLLGIVVADLGFGVA